MRMNHGPEKTGLISKKKSASRSFKGFVVLSALALVLSGVFATLASAAKTKAATTVQGGQLFKAADPSIIFSNGQYYGVYVSGTTIYVRTASTVQGLATATPKAIWSNSTKSEVWAPEILKYNGTYYVYFTYGAGAAHRMYVISSASPDSGYGAETKVMLPDDKWAIDGVLFTYNSETWFAWSGWPGDTNGIQNIYVARMTNPATATGPRYMIASPTNAWEKRAGGSFGLPYVNEAPEPYLDPNGQLHIGYSANGYWSSTYCVADLRLRAGGDVTNSADWYKPTDCLLSSTAVMSGVGTLATKSKGTGHHGMILPDGDINQTPAAGTTTQFAYAAVPNNYLYLPNSYRYWFWGNKTWLQNITYTNSTGSDTGWTPKYYE